MSAIYAGEKGLYNVESFGSRLRRTLRLIFGR